MHGILLDYVMRTLENNSMMRLETMLIRGNKGLIFIGIWYKDMYYVKMNVSVHMQKKKKKKRRLRSNPHIKEL